MSSAKSHSPSRLTTFEVVKIGTNRLSSTTPNNVVKRWALDRNNTTWYGQTREGKAVCVKISIESETMNGSRRSSGGYKIKILWVVIDGQPYRGFVFDVRSRKCEILHEVDAAEVPQGQKSTRAARPRQRQFTKAGRADTVRTGELSTTALAATAVPMPNR
jgi:hypothetical protein